MKVCQDGPFKPGDRVEYKRYSYDKEWSDGTVIRLTPSGKQVIVREKPNEFFKEGFERAYSLDEIRLVGAAPKPKEPGQPKLTRPAPAPAPVARGGGLLTQADILNYLRTRLGDQPFQHPEREAIRKELGELIKQRGVNFRYQNLSDFSNQLGKYGASSEVIFPIQDNYGPPTKQAFLMGTWSMDIIGAPVTVTRDDKVYRQGELGAKGGVLTVSPNGTYTWQAYKNDAPVQLLRGTWRKATPTEMRYQGGDGIVLLKAKSGWDWVMCQDRQATSGEWVRVAEVVSRQVREFGARAKR